jgi:hypothetical protein
MKTGFGATVLMSENGKTLFKSIVQMAFDNNFACSLLNVTVWKEYTPLPRRNQGMTPLTAFRGGYLLVVPGLASTLLVLFSRLLASTLSQPLNLSRNQVLLT